MKTKSLLVRFRDRDSREGISRATMQKLARTLDLSETAALHRALVEYAQRHLPAYPKDDGPLTDQQHAKIKELVGDKFEGAETIDSLFEEELSNPVTPRASKRVSSSRSR